MLIITHLYLVLIATWRVMQNIARHGSHKSHASLYQTFKSLEALAPCSNLRDTRHQTRSMQYVTPAMMLANIRVASSFLEISMQESHRFPTRFHLVGKAPTARAAPLT